MRQQTILVVDDYEGLVNLYRAALARTGYRVETAASGSEAVKKARELNPDLVVMDVNLPDMDGLAAAFLLRSAPDTRHIRILAISGQSEHELRDEAIGMGCIDFLQKPFTLGTLVEAVRGVLKTARVA